MKKKEQRTAYCFLLPSIFGTAVFVLFPFLDVIRRSFFQAVGGKFVGIRNYLEVLSNDAFQQALCNTVKFLAVCLPILLVLSFAAAAGIYRLTWEKEWLEGLFLVPVAVPAASIVVFWKIFFHSQGVLNQILDWLHLTGRDWMHTEAAFGVLAGIYIWKNLGYDMVLWLAGLTAVSEEQYEAAKVGGASRFQTFLYITIPQMKTTMIMIGVLSFIRLFQVFREAYLMSGAYPHSSIYMLQHLFYNWFSRLDIQKMSAAAVMLAAGISILFGWLERWKAKEDW